jgi:hypothetical protein
MKKLKLQLEDLAVDSFTTDKEHDARGTVEGHNATQYGGTCDTPCGPGGSADWAGCSTGVQGCRTMYGWTGCDYSCVFGPCESFEECSFPC